MHYEPTAAGILMPVHGIGLSGVWQGQIVHNGEVIDEFEDHNILVNEGLNHALDVLLHGSTQVATWYIGVFEGNYTPVATATAASITADSTESTAYDETTRVAYVEAAASSQSTTNSASKATFTFNATKTIYGAFLVSNSTKSGTTGTLLSAARFSSSKAVASADQLLLTYTINASSV